MESGCGGSVTKAKTKTLWILFFCFFKAGTFTFAGGLAMLPMLEVTLTEKNQLLSKEEFFEYATLAQTMPGIIAMNCAFFVGRHVAGIPGMLVAGLGACFSAFVLMLAATIGLQHVPQAGPVAGAMRAIRVASAAFILSAAVSLGKRNVNSLSAAIIMAAAFFLIVFFKVSTVLVVLGAAVTGILLHRHAPPRKGGPSP